MLQEDREAFSQAFIAESSSVDAVTSLGEEEGRALLLGLLQSNQSSLSEYELFNLASTFARKRSLDISIILNHLDMSALTAQEKHALSFSLKLSSEEHPYIWNSLIRSDILKPRDLYQRALNRPFSIQRLYSSKHHGLFTFFEYLRRATQEYTRKLLILQVTALSPTCCSSLT